LAHFQWIVPVSSHFPPFPDLRRFWTLTHLPLLPSRFFFFPPPLSFTDSQERYFFLRKSTPPFLCQSATNFFLAVVVSHIPPPLFSLFSRPSPSFQKKKKNPPPPHPPPFQIPFTFLSRQSCPFFLSSDTLFFSPVAAGRFAPPWKLLYTQSIPLLFPRHF